MQWRHPLMIKTGLLGVWLLPAGLTHADTALPTGANFMETRDSLADASHYMASTAPQVGMNAIDSRQAGDAVDSPLPMPLPGLLLLAATGAAYVWQSKPMARARRKPATASLA